MKNAAQIEAELLAALEQAEQAKLLPVSDWTRGAHIIATHSELLRKLPPFLASIRGQRDMTQKLIELVAELLQTCSPTPDGAAEWAQGIPPGRAMKVRRILNSIKSLMRQASENPLHVQH